LRVGHRFGGSVFQTGTEGYHQWDWDKKETNALRIYVKFSMGW